MHPNDVGEVVGRHSAVATDTGDSELGEVLDELQRALDAYDVDVMVTMVDETGARSRSHGIRPSVLDAQAERLRLERIAAPCAWETYDRAFVSVLRRLRRDGDPLADFSARALDRLQHYAWPGNVRELKNVVESLVVTTNCEVVDVQDLPSNIRASATPSELVIRVGMTMAEIEREILRRYLAAYPTKKAAAQALGIGLRTLHAKVKHHQLERARPRRRTTA